MTRSGCSASPAIRRPEPGNGGQGLNREVSQDANLAYLWMIGVLMLFIGY